MTIRLSRAVPADARSIRALRVIRAIVLTSAVALSALPATVGAQGAAHGGTTRPAPGRRAALDAQILEITPRRIDQLLAGFATEQTMRRRLALRASPVRVRGAAEVAAAADALTLPDSVGSEASGLKPLQYVVLRERVRAYLAGGDAARYGWSFTPAEVSVLRSRARELAPLAPPEPPRH